MPCGTSSGSSISSCVAMRSSRWSRVSSHFSTLSSSGFPSSESPTVEARSWKARFLLVCDRDADPTIKEAAAQLCATFRDVVEIRWGSRHGEACCRTGRIALHEDWKRLRHAKLSVG